MSDFLTLRRAILDRQFARMNAVQRRAVFQVDGPLLILAGAGSGKTTVLVNRIANIIRFGDAYASEQVPDDLTAADLALLEDCAAGRQPIDDRVAALCAVDPCPAWRILAITFTNKAAGELKQRLTDMLGEEGGEVMASTFHSFCARILRREGEQLGFSSHFTIYDTDDSRRLMKTCMKELGVEEKVLGHKAILAEIGRAKDTLQTPQQFAATVAADARLKQVAACWTLYQKRLREADAMDFDDLLCYTVMLFEQFPEVLHRYQKRYRYLMVDEYQDTNHAQYRLISLLAEASGNLCVVGDDDQSIYKFRGATIENILNFEQEFRGCAVIRLEQNYRSTKHILDAANAVIAKNRNRKGKTLWTENPAGDLLQVHVLDNEHDEGRLIADTVLEEHRNGRPYSDFAVLYRANAQSNAIENALMKSGVPYRVLGGHRFTDTLEIRDALAYLRVINNPDDAVSLRRIINTPKRGIGDATLDKAAQIADGLGISLYEVLHDAANYPDLSRAAAKLKPFCDMIDELRTMNDDPDVSVRLLYQTMLEKSGYLAMWELAGDEEAGRVDNLHELESSLLDYEQRSESDAPDLSGFLEEMALFTDIDNYDTTADRVVLMTMHAAKGLEFPVVFLPGFEDGLFPGMQTIYNPDEMEEERRLCYVAITRARQQLYLTRANSRMLYGSTTRHPASRFLEDIPPELIEEHEAASSGGFGRFGGEQRGFRDRRPTASAERKPIAAKPMGGFGSKPSIGIGAAAKPAAAKTAYAAGDRVAHKTFGEGVIREVKPMSGDTLLTIDFGGTTKKLMANYANLQKL